MLETWDYVVIAFYLVFTMSIGVICKKVARNSSDFFRGGGNMLWWMTGMSGVAAGLSAWTFTAAASRVYEMGFLMVILYWLWVPAYLVLYFYLARRYRQMRVITVADGINRRYGRYTEQFWIWIQIPANLLIGAMWLLTVSIFMSAAIGINTSLCILILGIVVACVSIGAGAWSVMASDFIQITIILVGSVTVLIRSLLLPEVGGVSGFLEKIPERFTDFSLSEAPSVWVTFLLLSIVMRTMQAADISQEGAKFLSVKDGGQAKKATIVIMCGFVIVPIIAFIPVMISAIVFPDLSVVFPDMKNPEEGAYMAIAAYVMPKGMVGLIVCAMFAASISSIDTALNRNAGFLVKNFYKEFIRPDADEKEQLLMGRIFTAILAGVLIMVSTIIAKNRTIGLFEFSNLLFSLIIPPMVVPAVFGFIYKKTPPWSGWSTVIVGFGAAFFTKFFVSIDAAGKYVWGLDRQMNDLEHGDVTFIVITTITLAASVSWFFFTSLFYKRSSEKSKESVEALFKDMRTPIDHVAEKTENRDAVQYRVVGSLSLLFGIALMSGVLIPNDLSGRLLFIWCGGVISLVGFILLMIYRKKKALEERKQT